MSCWTHITACLSVETGIVAKKPELKRRVKEFLKNAPEITGSEGPADVFVNIQSGYDWYMSRDCERCKYRDSLRDIIENGEEYQECDAPKGYDCSAEYQTRVIISIQGDLRDRIKDQTEREFNDFMKYITTKYYVRDYSVNIEGE